MLHLEALWATALWAAFGVGYWLARRTWRREALAFKQSAIALAELAMEIQQREKQALREKGILEAIRDGTPEC